MKSSQVFLRALLAVMALCIIQIVAGILVPMKTTPPAHMEEWLIVTNALTAGALSVAAARTEWRGWKLGLAVASIPLILVGTNVIEGVFYLGNAHFELPGVLAALAEPTISSVLSLPVWMVLFGRRAIHRPDNYHSIQSKSRGKRLWRFVVSDLTYLVLYFVAGLIIFPHVKDFYASRQMPSIGTIVLLQVLVRGPVFIMLCLLLRRMLDLPRLGGALAVAALFAILSGVVPLLVPNPYLPDSVRWIHFAEVTSENFIFGGIVAWLWGPPPMDKSRV